MVATSHTTKKPFKVTSLRLAHVISSSNFSNWYQSWASPSKWYATREIHSLFGIFWNSKNCSDWQIQLVGSSLSLKRGKSSLVTFGIKVPPDPVEPWLVRLCELSASFRLWELSPWLPFQLPAIWSKRACKTAIIYCNSLRVCYWLEAKEARLATLFASISTRSSPMSCSDTKWYEPPSRTHPWKAAYKGRVYMS